MGLTFHFFSSQWKKVLGWPASLGVGCGLASLGQRSLAGCVLKLTYLRCVGWLSSAVPVPCQTQGFLLEADEAMALERSRMAAALSPAGCRGCGLLWVLCI